MSKPNRLILLGTAVCLLAAACGGGSKGNGQVGSGDLIPPSPTTIAQDTTPAPAAATPGQQASPATPAGHHSTGTLPYYGGPSGGSGNSLPATPAASGEDNAALGGSGSYARVLLHAAPATAIQFELLEQSSAVPNMTAVNYDVSMVHKVTQKPVSIGKTIPIPGGPQGWTPAQMSRMVETYGTKNMNGAKTAILHLLIVHGQLANSSGVLGVAFRGDILAIFPDQTQGQVSLSGNQVAEAIYLHETGHLLGMVDEVLNDHRADPNDPNQPSAHNPDKKSVMYYAIDTTGLTTAFTGGPPIDFDSADYSDFTKLRAGA